MNPAPAASDAFLQGQGIPVDPRRIEDELSQLWGPAAEQAGGPDLDHPAVTRVVLANLVVMSPCTDPNRLDCGLDAVATRYPCRAIVLRLDDDPARTVRAEISAICHLPAPGQPQVCSERIALRAGPNAIDLLPGAVRPLLEADLPRVLWWADDPRSYENFYKQLADDSTRIILDLPDPEADPAALAFALDGRANEFTRDLAWFGITRWRELIAQFFDAADSQRWMSSVAEVEVRAIASTIEGVPRVAAWLAGWLAGQLGWTLREGPRSEPGRIEARFEGPGGGAIAVNLVTTVDPSAVTARLVGVTLTARGPEGEARFVVDRPSPSCDEVRVESRRPSQEDVTRRVHAPNPNAPCRVASALESTRNDPPFRNALPHMLRLIGSSS